MQKKLSFNSIEGVVDTYGGELISYKNDGKEYIWTGDPAYWNGHAPVLFPFVSALKDWKVKFNGVEYSLTTKHGFSRKSEFELVDISEKEATFELVPNEKIAAQYPFNFSLKVTHTLADDGYTTKYTVKNNDSKDMYFCIGGHAGYCVDGSCEDYDLIFEKEENLDMYYTDKESLFDESYKLDKKIVGNKYEIKYDDFDVDAIVLKNTASKKVTLLNKKTQKGMEFIFNGFENLTLWTPPKKQAPFFCLEPWNGLPAFVNETGNFEDKPGCITLEPGKEYSVSYSIKCIK